MGGFVHLHLHTEYSLLDGATRIKEIADKAIAEGQGAVAITDHGVMYGCVDFYNALKAKGVKPIIGCEVYVAPRSRHKRDGKQDSSGNHLVLLCKNAVGYKNLCKMVSESFIDGFYSKPRVDMELLRRHSEGLIALSGCLAGIIPRYILAGSINDAEHAALEFKEIFGEDFYLEIQNHSLDDERKVAFGIKLISEKLGIPMVATNDVHYLEKSDADVQATLMCIQTNTVITDGRPFGFETDEFYFKSTEQMRALFSAFPGACDNTVKIAEKCNFDFEFDKLHLPDFKSVDGKSHKEKLRLDAFSGFERHLAEGRFDLTSHTLDEYQERMEYELSVIDKMGFNAYYLIVADFVAFAKSKGIPVGPGRGSGAGSLVAFLVGITDVDPIAFDLLFERFLNSERVSMPDFDIDFCYTRREEVIDYVKERYGQDKVAQIVTFGTLAARAAVRDVGRALGMPYGKVDTVAKMIPRDPSITIERAVAMREMRELYLSDPEVRRLLDYSMRIEGMPRHASTHAAGVVITERPTCEYVPLSYSGTGVVIQFDMNTAASLGLVKFDFLGLRYLTIIDDTEKMIKRKHPDFNLSKIPVDDKAAFALLCEARTDGVFQLESGGMKQVLSRLQPSTIEDVIAAIALYRPGPMDSINDFIARKHGKAPIVYKTDKLADILGVTYGCIVYQEQVMQICRCLAGYSFAKADIVRRAMSKKKAEAMAAERDGFISGCLASGVSREVAEDIFNDMASFAKYAFNKSHATAYGMLSYRTAYLKAHYPAEYFAALLTSVLDDAQKVREYIMDASKYGVRVLPPDINESDACFSVCEGGVRFGLLAIKNVGRIFSDAVVAERQKKPFASFEDFISRMIERDLNKRTVESLVKCGVFDRLGTPRSALVSCFENILDSEQERKRNNVSGQIDLFGLGERSIVSTGYAYPDMAEFSLRDLLILEKESSGMYFSGHLIDSYSDIISNLEVDRISEIHTELDELYASPDPKYRDKSQVRIAGIITEKQTKVTKNGATMAFIKVEDRSSEIDVIVFARQYERFSSILQPEEAVLLSGAISKEEGEAARILLSEIEPLSSARARLSHQQKKTAQNAADEPKEQRVYVKVKDLNDPRIQKIYRVCAFNKGNCRVVIFDESTKKYSALKDALIAPTPKAMEKLCEIFSKDCVVLR